MTDQNWILFYWCVFERVYQFKSIGAVESNPVKSWTLSRWRVLGFAGFRTPRPTTIQKWCPDNRHLCPDTNFSRRFNREIKSKHISENYYIAIQECQAIGKSWFLLFKTITNYNKNHQLILMCVPKAHSIYQSGKNLWTNVALK